MKRGGSAMDKNKTAAKKLRTIGIIALVMIIGAGSSALLIWSRNASGESQTSVLSHYYAEGGIAQKQKQLHGNLLSSPAISVNYCVLEMSTDARSQYPALAEKVDALNDIMEKRAQKLKSELMTMEGDEYDRLDATLAFRIYRGDEKIFSAALSEDVNGTKGSELIILQSDIECMNIDPQTGEIVELFRKEGSDSPGLFENENRFLEVLGERMVGEGYLTEMQTDERNAFLREYLYGNTVRWCVTDEEVCYFYDPADFDGADDGGVRAGGILLSKFL
jgi:flagellar basal body-associated protein FliL